MRILFNGRMTDSFSTTRGIRQRDPLSPYLFVLCLERLGHLIQSKVETGLWKGIKCTRACPTLSHLFFADDLLLFSEASLDQLEVMESCLKEFCELSGQRVSLMKSRLCFSKNVSPTLARSLSRKSGISLTSCLGKYLGVPLLQERVNKTTFLAIVDNVHTRLSGWKASYLSLAGLGTLIKAVTSGMPNHLMQTNLLPAATLETLDKANGDFLWGSENGKRKIHLMPWEQVCKPKKYGGIDIRPSKEHNVALLIKLLRRIIREPEALWVRLLTGKYLRQKDIFTSSKTSGRKSHLWRSLLKIIREFKKGIVWVPKQGTKVRFWRDKWLLDKPLSDLISNIPDEHFDKKVSQYIMNENIWNWSILENLLPQNILLHLAAFHISESNCEEDEIAWNQTPSGNFSTKSAFDLLVPTTAQQPDPTFSLIWKLKIPHRLQYFISGQDAH